MEIDAKKLNMAKKKGIKLIILFGSQTQNTAGKDSDFDIAVLTVPGKNISEMENYNDILFFLSDSLRLPDFKIDLTNLNNANPLLRYEIFKKGTLLYGEKMLAEEEKAFSFRDFIDSKSLLELENIFIQKRQEMLTKIISN